MSAAPEAVLEAARSQAGMSFEELWIAYFALGGDSPLSTVRSYLGGLSASSMEYNVLALALNERFSDQGYTGHPVPYRDELP